MRKSIEEKRLEKRACFEPSEMGHIIEATLDGKEYSFKTAIPGRVLTV